MLKEKIKKVVVGMSGGVDSSVAAALLKKQGYEVLGVFMKYWNEPVKDAEKYDKKLIENKCCSLESLKDARTVANQLGIPLLVVDAQKEFKKEVVDNFLNEYKKGRTPNPCVVCNKLIKFKVLLQKAKELKADFVATGHYGRVTREIKNQKSKVKKYNIYQAKDEKKDQTYFLWQLPKKNLNKILFPIGDYEKEEVRKMAEKFGLITATKKESFEVCFVPGDDYNGFLERNLPKVSEGNIKTVKEELLEEKHEGLPFYTIGQRKGLQINAKTPNWEPFYVLNKDIKTNTLIIGKDKELYSKQCRIEKINLLEELKNNQSVQVKIRYGMKPVNAKIVFNNKKTKIVFTNKQRAITPGQSAVFYKKEKAGIKLLGGGIIS